MKLSGRLISLPLESPPSTPNPTSSAAYIFALIGLLRRAVTITEVLHDQVVLGHVVQSPARPLIQAVERNGLQGRLYVVGGQHGVPLQPVRVVFPPLSVRRAQAELEHGLEASPEVLVEEAVNDGVDAAVEERQPVGEGVDVDVDDSVLLLCQGGVVAQHHEGPQREPGDDEKQRDD
ncbi:hypothetical protein EYF80_031587 [Liparis tanakae]|uniref:Uncharacterized protein n=1 Tax=Liparis tanakae TaxID=230148 RepID=A0A4Z2GZX7_9TELE|nr:hypothetical protein EYF80_031587 [Liparis tanakae]